ncbi:MAG: M15 family metallopeptidase [Peptococcaceae bacterium]|nr:M15 family metallopeptidase [Peptococcaceae bacterium]
MKACSKRRIIVILTVLISIVLFSIILGNKRLTTIPTYVINDPIYDATMKRDVLCLMLAYPEYIKDLEITAEGKVFVILKSGKKLLYDDRKEKNTWQKSGNPDIQDMFEQIYPLNEINELLPNYYNPGIVRIYPLLHEVYGKNKKTILENLVKVSIGYRFVEFNQNNGAADALKSVIKELLPLTRQSHKIYAACFPSSGTFNYRLIGGTNRLSAHAFGIAIDLNNNKYDYWRYATRDEGQKRLESYPQEVVRVFEKYGFIWGGKWGNFDIMHYEYRPEIILKALYFSDQPIPGLPWYDGLQDNSQAMEYVWFIEQKLKSN